MEIRALRTFNTVVAEGGILAASKKLHTVQSNITTRIKKLEEELKAELFFREGKKLILTPAGRVLLKYARQILQLEIQTVQAVSNSAEDIQQLNLGSMEAFAAFQLPIALQPLRLRYPALQLHIETDTSAGLVKKVIDYKLDAAFVGGKVTHPELEVTPVFTEELVLVSASNACANTNDCLIVFKEGCAYRARAMNWMRETGRQSYQTMELGTLDGILGCIAIGLGCTLMPKRLVVESRYMDQLDLQSLPPHISEIPTVLVQHKRTAKLASMKALCEIISTHYNED